MARNHARIYASIWQDEDFVRLSSAAQRVYMLAISQPGVTFAGVVGYTARRWSMMANDTSPEDIERCVDELQRERFVLVDTDTEELLIRSFVTHDGLLESPNLVKAMWKDFDAIFSPMLRAAFLWNLPEKGWTNPPAGVVKPSENPWPNPSGNPLAKGYPIPVPVPTPLPVPSSSSRVDENGQHAERDDDDGLEAVAELLAQHDLERLRADKPEHHVGSEERWLDSAKRRRLNLDGDAIRAVLAANPSWSPEACAKSMLVESPSSSPLDATAAAQRERINRAERQARGEFECPKCEDRGVVEVDGGMFDDCDCKFSKAAS